MVSWWLWWLNVSIISVLGTIFTINICYISRLTPLVLNRCVGTCPIFILFFTSGQSNTFCFGTKTYNTITILWMHSRSMIRLKCIWYKSRIIKSTLFIFNCHLCLIKLYILSWNVGFLLICVCLLNLTEKIQNLIVQSNSTI